MIEKAKQVFDIEIKGLEFVKNNLPEYFNEIIEKILSTKGKLIVSGMGKSGHIGKKIAATLASTGTPSFFIHPGEAFHGDLGMIEPHDAVLLISYSGETEEILRLIPFLNWNKNLTIGMSGNSNSSLAQNTHYHLNINVPEEACPLSLAPTSSTTATLVMGDALAVSLMEARNFKPEDFARFHPGGSLGRRLLAKVKDFMRSDDLPYLDINSSARDLIFKLAQGRLGLVLITENDKFKGIITDGDFRRALENINNLNEISLAGITNTKPLLLNENAALHEAESLMLEKKINTVLIGDAQEIKGVFQLYYLR